MPHAFDRFYQIRTKGTSGGAGLGLAIVKKILEAHGKMISVESKIDAGTIFWFDLPTVEARKSPRRQYARNDAIGMRM